MALSGIVKSWAVPSGTLTNEGNSYAGAYYSWEWSGEQTAPAQTTITWELWGRGRPNESPRWLTNECYIDIIQGSTTTNIYTLPWNTNQSNGDGTNTCFYDGQTKAYRTSGSFIIYHDENGAASFDVKIKASFYAGAGTGKTTTTTVTLDTNLPEYTVTVNKGTGISSVSGGGSYKSGSSAIISATPSTGYTWSKWSGDSTSTSNPLTVTVNSNKSYTANATINTYTITYNKGSYGSGNNTTATKTYGTDLTLKGAIFTRTGYTQTGWASDAAGTTRVYDLSGTYTSNSAATLYPYWTPNSYILTFNANGGVNTSGGNFALTNPATGYGATESWVTVTYNSSNFSLMGGNNPTRIGYEFLGWYTAATGGTQIYNASGTSTNNGTYWNTSGLWNSTSNQIVYAQWKPLAIMSVKVDDTYKTGKPYVKVNGEWKQGIAVYVKVNDEWKISII